MTLAHHAMMVGLLLAAAAAGRARGRMREPVPGRDADQRGDAVVHPEAAAVAATLVIAGPWMMTTMLDYLRQTRCTLATPACSRAPPGDDVLGYLRAAQRLAHGVPVAIREDARARRDRARRRHAAVPIRVKIGLAAFMALVVAPTLGAMPDVTVFSAQGIWIVVTQFLIGVAMGFTMQIVFAAVGAAGDFIGLSRARLRHLRSAHERRDARDGPLPERDRDARVLAVGRSPAGVRRARRVVPVAAGVGRPAHAPGWRTLASFGTTVFEMGCCSRCR